MKKLLLILLLLTCTITFAQKDQNNGFVQKEKSIEKVTAYPNPFTSNTRITFHSKKQQNIILNIKNLLGKTIYKEEINSKKGVNTIRFYKNNLDSGMYIYSIQTDSEIVSKRLVIK